MKPGAKLSSTAISARARAISPARALQAIIRARRIGARCETWIADSHQRTASAWLRSVKCAIAIARWAVPIPVTPRAQSQRKLGVRFGKQFGRPQALDAGQKRVIADRYA